MIFEVDRHNVTEGDVVEIHWQCAGADSVSLTIDNGFKTNQIALDNVGSKKFRLNRSKGRTKLTLSIVLKGRRHEKTLRVKVKKMPTIKAETVDNTGRPMSALKQWWQKVLTNWHEASAKWRMAMQVLPPKKQIAAKLLLILGATMLLSALWPKAYSLALILISIYLLVVLLRK